MDICKQKAEISPTPPGNLFNEKNLQTFKIRVYMLKLSTKKKKKTQTPKPFIKLKHLAQLHLAAAAGSK